MTPLRGGSSFPMVRMMRLTSSSRPMSAASTRMVPLMISALKNLFATSALAVRPVSMTCFAPLPMSQFARLRRQACELTSDKSWDVAYALGGDGDLAFGTGVQQFLRQLVNDLGAASHH